MVAKYKEILKMDSLKKYVIGSGFMTSLGGTHFCSKVIKGKLQNDILGVRLKTFGVIGKVGNITIIRHSEGICLEDENMSVVLWTHSSGDPIGLPKWKYITNRILHDSIHVDGEFFEIARASEARWAERISKMYIRQLAKCEFESNFQTDERNFLEGIRKAAAAKQKSCCA